MSSYIHADGKIGVLVEVDCETDFVARTDAFQEFAREVASARRGRPDLRYVSEDDIAEDVREAELRVFREQAAGEGKPENVQEKIVEGRLNKCLEEVVLLNQKHVNEDKHESKTHRGAARRAGREHGGEHRRSGASRGSRSARSAMPEPRSGGSC